MQGFDVEGGDLVVGGRRLSALVAEVGQTPFYAYDRQRIAHRVAEVRAALPSGVDLHYAIKANPMPELLAFMAPMVDGLDVASAGEMQRALAAGMAPGAISFAGPGKRASELDAAVAAGVLVNVESFRELPLLAEASARHGRPARVAVRVNPDFELRGAGMRMGGGAKPFGVDTEQVPALLRAIATAGQQFEGFHLYAGSQMLKGELLAQATLATGELLLRLSADAPAPVRHLNLGGGWGIPYFSNEQALDLAPVTAALATVQDRVGRALPGARLQVELGRYLVGEAGVYVAQVLDRKVSRGQVFLITDGGLHHHLAASGNFGQVIRRNYPVAIGNRMGTAEREVVSIVGPLCTPLDLLAERVELPVAQPGDWVVVFQSGAYGASASPQAFLGHPPCAEVLV
ncbi:pyridoxal-dependent decarboxylase, exosortase A system-associated [Hydrogenophaga sp.]|uniref:pyridoxal-dependent decarboxylase, exosortase A system-associated n=1 Tax=Hydrogenophaga sp. TaxID=1904254 RepID=UPI00286DA563|nr:pyridoxal-dependent decarboxylase, exosortase A system-associated [Hydrogenophaga sp.]